MDALTTEDPPRIGPYRMLARLGAGGMGRVYLARSEGGRTVAVKVVKAEFAQHPEFRRRFALEVTAARRVGGSWTAPVLDADTDAATPWVATGYVAGPDLHSVVAKEHGPLPEYSVRALANGLAHALQAIHGAALVHRDLKPSNILLTIDGPRVIDFGIARALDMVADGARTHTGAVIGSPGFMSPEQVRGQRLTPAADVFCVGSVLAYAATGRMPFGTADSGVHAVMFRIAEEEPDLTGVPQGILELVRACLAKDPTQRPTVDHLLAWTADAAIDNGHPWLPGPLLAQLGRHAAQLLDADAPAQEPSSPAVRIAPSPPPAPTHGSSEGPTRKPRRRSRSRAAWIAAATGVAVTAATAVVLTQLPDGKPADDQQAGADSTSGSTGQKAKFDGAWAGLVQRTDSSISDEHEYLRVDVDGDAAPGEKAADFLYLSKDTYCKVESRLRAKKGNTMTLASFDVVKAVPATAARRACDLRRSGGLKSSAGKLTWTMGDMTADLKPMARPGSRSVPGKFLGTWKSEIQGTLTIKQGAVGTKVGTYTGWSIDRRCNGTSQLVSATKNIVTLSPLELDASTPRTIGCPHGVPQTITWKSKNQLELRYPESIAVVLTRVE
ncbi:serine/threonine-protein kinase [Streptomyces sp. DG2A-72]|uniref:serine/threonine-protein kinase n=1 Tax=Streptomyces sp. DG2A-72 TaxID=3051386 RepID=UPI00265BC81E|nr:serine/threonine-protein kinase [Streptomyces sp. DG2A-72]MDO0938855.1 serine/threonine-protein kinase [Streptomyces sp. DG2A-72]